MASIRNIAIILAVHTSQERFFPICIAISAMCRMETGCGHEGDCVRTSAEAVFEFYQDKQTGQLMSRAINDTATFEVLIAHAVPDLVTNVLILVGTGILLFVINPLLAALTLIPYRFWYWVREYLPKSSSEFPGGAGKTWGS